MAAKKKVEPASDELPAIPVVGEAPVGEPVTEDKPAEAPAPVAEPPAEAPAEAPAQEPDLREEVLRILKMRNTHKPSPSLVEFTMRVNLRKRYALIDIDGDTIAAAWARYKELAGDVDKEGFIILVHEIMEKDLPRIFRQVDYVRLD